MKMTSIKVVRVKCTPCKLSHEKPAANGVHIASKHAFTLLSMILIHVLLFWSVDVKTW